MSDESRELRRESYRYDENGRLTVWGARDVLLHIVDDALLKVWNEESGVERSNTSPLDEVRAAYAVRLDRALDDVEDAYLRTHDRLGCTRLSGMRDEGAPRRYACDACRARDVVPECDESARVDAGDDDRVNVGSITLPVWVSRRDLDGYEAYADSQDDEDVEVNEAMREAGRRRRQMREDAVHMRAESRWCDLKKLIDATGSTLSSAEMEALAVIRERIFAGVPASRDAAWDASWDAVQDVRQLRDSDGAEACYDRSDGRDQTASGDDQSASDEVLSWTSSTPVGWVHVALQDALVVEAGDVLSVTQVIGSDGRTTAMTVTVTTAAELGDLDDDDETGGE